MASLADISRRAGVSIATASRVLNGSSHPVSEATRGRVLAAADELGYRPSELARALVKRTSRIIGVIVGRHRRPVLRRDRPRGRGRRGARGAPDDGLQRRPPPGRRARAPRRAARLPRRGRGVRGQRLRARADAAALREAVDALQAGGAAVVALAARDLDCPSVLVDNRGAARHATEHLLSLGHRRIAFVEGPPGLHTSAHRLEGFEEAMAAVEAEPVRVPGGFEYEAGDAAAAERCSRAASCPTRSWPSTTRSRSGC